MKRHLTTKKLILALIAILLLQVAFFTFFKMDSLSETERLMTGIYRRQLETILFSINQYAWDTINGWAGEVLAKRKGASREGWSEGSVEQTCDLTNRNRISGSAGRTS